MGGLKAYFQGRWGKHRKINTFRIIRQNMESLLCPVNGDK